MGSRSFKKVAIGISALLLSVAIHAQSRNFNIPAGDLKAALDAYVAATNQQVVFNPADLKGRLSKGAQGSMEPDAALAKLLEGTGLKLRRDSSGAVVIFFGEGGEAGASKEVVTQLERVEIFTKISHIGDSSRTGTRTDTDPMAVPLMVSSVDKEVLAQQQVRTMSDALANVAGVSDLTGSSVFSMRGFGAGVMRNGNLQLSGDAPDLPMISISKIEVVKGPEAIIAGTTAGYGGVVNLIAKAPQAQPITELATTVGSRGYYEVGVDIGRPVTADKSLLVRLVASKQGQGSTNLGYDGDNGKYFAPSLTWQNKDFGTDVTAQFEHLEKRRAPYALVMSSDTVLSDDLPPLRLEPATDGTLSKSNVTTLTLNQRLSEHWDLSIKHTEDRRHNWTDSVSSFPGSYLGLPATTYASLGFASNIAYESKATKVELRTKFNTGPLAHKLLFAYDSTTGHIVAQNQSKTLFSTDPATGAVVDLVPTLGPAFGVPGPVQTGGSDPKDTGVLAMDQVTWGKWVGLVGLRSVKHAAHNRIGTDIGVFKKTLPSLGLLYRLAPTLSFYGNASKGFTPNSGNFSFDGGSISPENATQFELGVKSLSSDKRLSASFAAFSVKQKNVAVSDLTHGPYDCGGNPCYLSVPGVDSKGIEVEVSGEIFTGMAVRANYTYTDKKADDPSQLGAPYARHLGSVWAIYRFQGDEVDGWWVSAGLQTRSERLGVTVNTLGNPGRTRYDASVGYDAARWSYIAGIKNLTDKRIYPLVSGSLGQGSVLQPREFNLTVRYSFD